MTMRHVEYDDANFRLVPVSAGTGDPMAVTILKALSGNGMNNAASLLKMAAIFCPELAPYAAIAPIISRAAGAIATELEKGLQDGAYIHLHDGSIVTKEWAGSKGTQLTPGGHFVQKNIFGF